MPYTIIEDFGTTLEVAERMTDASVRAAKTRPILKFISSDMIRVTGILWDTQAARFGGWKRLSPKTIAHKGNRRILFTEGSNPSYTPHPADNVLADSVTKIGGAHQILNITDRTIEFGTDVRYAARQYKTRPFILFSKYDRERWAMWIVNYISKPFDEEVLKGTPLRRTPAATAARRYAAPPRTATASLGFTSIPAFGGGFMMRGPGGRFTGVYGKPVRGGYGHNIK